MDLLNIYFESVGIENKMEIHCKASGENELYFPSVSHATENIPSTIELTFLHVEI